MNIYYLHRDPRMAARYHNDRHVSKQILESAQIMVAAHIALDGMWAVEAAFGTDLPLRPTHGEHPCVKWVSVSDKNYDWLQTLAVHLGQEYRARFGSVHVMAGLIDNLSVRPMKIRHVSATAIPQCMPEEYRGQDAVTAYRQFYYHEKMHLARWSAPAEIPPWWKKMMLRDRARTQPETGAQL
jgi:hypothetical protein